MMPRLQAEETLDAATAAALGSGAMERQEARRVAAALERQADPRSAARADRRVLAMIGIGVEDVPRSPAGGEA